MTLRNPKLAVVALSAAVLLSGCTAPDVPEPGPTFVPGDDTAAYNALPVGATDYDGAQAA